jgi:hypothetical protein
MTPAYVSPLVGVFLAIAWIIAERHLTPWLTVHDTTVVGHHWTERGARRAAARTNRRVEKRVVREGHNAVLATLYLASNPPVQVRRRNPAGTP